jgi:hypothetical protein
VPDLGHADQSEEGDIIAKQSITSKFVSILIDREENMPSGMSRNKSVEVFHCTDSGRYIDEHFIPIILRFETNQSSRKIKLAFLVYNEQWKYHYIM